MNNHDVGKVILTLEALFDRADWNIDKKKLWRRKIAALKHDPGQVVWAIEEHRMASKYHEPNWQAIKGLLSNVPLPGERAPDEKADRDDENLAFDMRRARTKAWIAQASPDELAAVTERAAARHERLGNQIYADRLRGKPWPWGESGGGLLGGSVVAAIAAQLEIDGILAEAGG